MSKLILEKAADLKIFLDPFRSRIMTTMKDENRPMTVSEIADRLGEVPAKVHYHVKKLESIGVLFIKHTKVVNGIVAKYYDFTADTIALSVHSESDNGLSTLLTKTYGGYYDEAKQRFFDLYNSKQNSSEIQDNEAFFYIKNCIPLDPERLDELHSEIRVLMEKYRSSGDNAADYSAFFSLVQIPRK